MSLAKLRVALVVPHIFMHRDILPKVIFSPGRLAISLANSLVKSGVEVTLYTPGPVVTLANNQTADLSYFEKELFSRNDNYLDLLKKHPFTFVTLARQVQGEFIAKAYQDANDDQYDIVHVYTNEEELGYTFARFCQKPVVFTHHDPYNFLVKYKNYMPKYRHLNWISMSLAQRLTMPGDTNWVGNIYHGVDDLVLRPSDDPTRDYFAYMGRIIEPKGVHLAIEAVKLYNQRANTTIPLKIAGKHYADSTKDAYWREIIEPSLGDEIQYIGFLDNSHDKANFLSNAKAVLVPSLFDEPFGMVVIESLSCGTPVVALQSGALPEIIDNQVGFVVAKSDNPTVMIEALADSLSQIDQINPEVCRQTFEEKFGIEKMAIGHLEVYQSLIRQ